MPYNLNRGTILVVNQVSNTNFGLIIGYVIPGFVAVVALAGVYPPIGSLLGFSEGKDFSAVGSIYALILSIGAGVVISGVRYFTIDALLKWCGGCGRCAWIGETSVSTNYTALADNMKQFETIIEDFYRHYQAYSNLFVSILFLALFVFTTDNPIIDFPLSFASVGVLAAVEIVLFASANNCFRNYQKQKRNLMGDSLDG